MTPQLKSALILLDNVFFGIKKYNRNAFAERLSQEDSIELKYSDTTISRLLKFIDKIFGIQLKFPKNGHVEIVEQDGDNKYHFVKSLLLYGKLKNQKELFLNHQVSFSTDTVFKNSEYIFELFDAITKTQKVKLIYQKFDSEEAKEHVINPILIKEYQGRWYLIGETEPGYFTVLGIDRIKNFEVLKTRFKPNLEALKLYQNTIGVNYNGPVEDVELWVEDFQLKLFETYPIHSSQRILSRDPKGGIISLRVVLNYEFRQLLASFLNKVKVLKPQSLREEMIGIFEEMKHP